MSISRSFGVIFALALLSTVASALPGLDGRAASDPTSGVALYGYDPVAYFTEGKPQPGRRDVEAEWGGVAWRFTSEANRAAFLSAPAVYAPRFGGYDPLSVARGAPAAGHPLLFLISKERLYLFQSREARSAFGVHTPAERRAAPLAIATAMSVEGASKPPLGWREFCGASPRECDAKVSKPMRVKLSRARLAELDRINRRVNVSVEPVTDQDHYGVEERWTYPTDGKGDTEDYVLQKRRELMAIGWPRQTLLITVVRDLKGDGHAVLTVVTDKGDYVLDNQADDIKPWFDTGYTFIKRQSQTDQNQWTLLGDGVGPVGVATSPN